MKKLDFIKDEKLIKQYLYDKLRAQPKYEFYLNFSNISRDLRPYIEANYFDYINVNYINDLDLNINYETRKHLNMLGRDYVNRYTWIKRDECLELLKKESEDPNYKLKPAVKDYLLAWNIKEKTIKNITNKWKELRALEILSFTKKDCVNSELAMRIHDDVAPKILELNGDKDTFNFKISVKKKNNIKYYSGRAYTGLCYTKNDLENKYKNYWDKVIIDERERRSDYFKSLEEDGYYVIDLGDMSSNFPNMLNCIKTGKYEDLDFHSKIANEYGISRSIAKMAAVRCCFNCRKVDILYGLLDKVDCKKITNELKEMEESGIFHFKNEKILLNRGRKVRDAHEFFSSHKDNSFFNYAANFLTSWDACHEIYKNDLAPSDLSMLTSAVEINVIYDAYEKGFNIVNAYDHAYLIAKNKDDWYDWKGEYAKTAERLVKLYYSNDYEIKERMSRGSIARIGTVSPNKKMEVRYWLKDHNYDFDAAAKEFHWSAPLKCYWKKQISESNCRPKNSKVDIMNWLKDHNYDFNAAAKNFGWNYQLKYYWKKTLTN